MLVIAEPKKRLPVLLWNIIVIWNTQNGIQSIVHFVSYNCIKGLILLRLKSIGKERGHNGICHDWNVVFSYYNISYGMSPIHNRKLDPSNRQRPIL